MKTTLVIIADLKHFKAFELETDPVGRKSLKTITALDNLHADGKKAGDLSDRAGNFQGKGASGSGENLNRETEKESRLKDRILENIQSVLEKNSFAVWHLALPAQISGEIIEQLKPEHRDKLKIDLKANLTNVPVSELWNHFQK